MNKHSPGPWIIRDVPGHATDIITEDLLYVCQVYGHKNKSGPMTANARLIAAAPMLLTTLQVLQRAGGIWPDLKPMVDEAVAKATGADA